MHLVQAGRLGFNLEYLIAWECPPSEAGSRDSPSLRLIMEDGRVYDLTGGDAEVAWAHIRHLIRPPPGPRILVTRGADMDIEAPPDPGCI